MALPCPAGRLLLWRKRGWGCDFPLREGQGHKGSDWGQGGTEWNVVRLCHLGCCSTESPAVLGRRVLPVLPRGAERRVTGPLSATWSSGLEKPPHVASLPSCGTLGRHQGLGRAGAGLVEKVAPGWPCQEQQPALFPLKEY